MSARRAGRMWMVEVIVDMVVLVVLVVFAIGQVDG